MPDKTDASLTCIWVQRLTLHPSKDNYSSDLTREGSVACIVSPEYEQSLSGVDGQLEERW